MAVSDDPRHGGADFGAPMTKNQLRFRALAKLVVARGILSWYNRIEVVGYDKVPDGPVILCPTHRSNMDTPFMGAIIERTDARWMTKDSVFANPFWTRVIVSLGGFPVKRGTFDRSSLNNARDVLARGEMLVIYPEGARQEGPRIKPVFEGAVWLASRAGVPIVPVGIGGSYGAMPIGAKIPRPKRVVIMFDDPFTIGEEGKRTSRKQLDVAAADLRERLQSIFDKAQIAAGTPNRAWSEDEPGINDRIEPWTTS